MPLREHQINPLTGKLAPPIVLVSPSVARPRRLLHIPVAVNRVPFLGVVGQSQAVLRALAVDKVARGMAFDHEVVSLGRADVDVCWVCACPIGNLVAGVVDDAQHPLRCRVRDLESVACWHHRSDGSFDREEKRCLLTVQCDVRFASVMLLRWIIVFIPGHFDGIGRPEQGFEVLPCSVHRVGIRFGSKCQ
jgi:hypothetical protein